MTGLAMLVSGWVSSRIGARRTLLAGLVLVVLFSALAGSSGSSDRSSASAWAGPRQRPLHLHRALVVVGAASGGLAGAIVLYEAALGLGISSAPLVGSGPCARSRLP